MLLDMPLVRVHELPGPPDGVHHLPGAVDLGLHGEATEHIARWMGVSHPP